MTDPIEVLETACSTSQTDHDWPAAIDAVVRLRDAARALKEWDEQYAEAMQARDWQTCDYLSDERDALDGELAAALAPFAQEER